MTTPTSATAALNIGKLYRRLDDTRRVLGLRWKDVANQCGMQHHSVFTRLSKNQGCSGNALARIMLWLDETDISPYLTVRDHTEKPKRP